MHKYEVKISAYMVDQESVIKRLVSIVQVLQVQVFCNIIRTSAQVAQASFHLTFQSSHGRRHQSTKSKAIALAVRES